MEFEAEVNVFVVYLLVVCDLICIKVEGGFEIRDGDIVVAAATVVVPFCEGYE